MFLFRLRLLWGTVAVASIAFMGVLWAFGGREGRPPPGLGLIIGVGLICGAGTAALTVLPGFVIYRYFYTQPPEFVAEPGEVVILEMPANDLVEGESRGGRLYVTDRRLAFCPHRYNVQLGQWSLPWATIVGFEPTDPVLWVHLTDGALVRLTVPRADELAARLSAERASRA